MSDEDSICYGRLSQRGVGCNMHSCSGLVHRMPVQDQRGFASDLLEQPLQECHKYGCLNVPSIIIKRALPCW